MVTFSYKDVWVDIKFLDLAHTWYSFSSKAIRRDKIGKKDDKN